MQFTAIVFEKHTKKSNLIQKMLGIKLIIKAIREEQMVSCTLENGFELLLYDHFAITKTY